MGLFEENLKPITREICIMHSAICKKCGNEWLLNGKKGGPCCDCDCYYLGIALEAELIAIKAAASDRDELSSMTLDAMTRYAESFRYTFIVEHDMEDDLEFGARVRSIDIEEEDNGCGMLEEDDDIAGDIICDRCEKHVPVWKRPGQDDDVAQMDHVANKLGWGRIKDDDGDDWDLCPVCLRFFDDLRSQTSDMFQDFFNGHIENGRLQVKAISTQDIPEYLKNETCDNCDSLKDCVRNFYEVNNFFDLDDCKNNCDSCKCK